MKSILLSLKDGFGLITKEKACLHPVGLFSENGPRTFNGMVHQREKRGVKYLGAEIGLPLRANRTDPESIDRGVPVA